MHGSGCVQASSPQTARCVQAPAACEPSTARGVGGQHSGNPAPVASLAVTCPMTRPQCSLLRSEASMHAVCRLPASHMPPLQNVWLQPWAAHPLNCLSRERRMASCSLRDSAMAAELQAHRAALPSMSVSTTVTGLPFPAFQADSQAGAAAGERRPPPTGLLAAQEPAGRQWLHHAPAAAASAPEQVHTPTTV